MKNNIQRILLKLSGEQFAGKASSGIDPEFLISLAKEIQEVIVKTGCQMVIVVGGGNFVRGATLSNQTSGIEPTTADQIGMLATIMNGMALRDVFKYCGQDVRLQTKIPIPVVAEPFIWQKALRHLEKGRVVIIGGGTGNPFMTTDTAAVSVARELGCTLVLKATKVDGIYTSDPAKDSFATKLSRLTYLEVLNNENIQVMDSAAMSMAKEGKIPIRVFDLLTRNNILRIVEGEDIGTLVS